MRDHVKCKFIEQGFPTSNSWDGGEGEKEYLVYVITNCLKLQKGKIKMNNIEKSKLKLIVTMLYNNVNVS